MTTNFTENMPSDHEDRFYLRRDGSNTMTGPLTLSGAPIEDTEAVNKLYADLQRAGAITEAGVDAQALVAALQSSLLAGLLDVLYLNRSAMPGAYQREEVDPWATAGIAAPADRYMLVSPARLAVEIGGTLYFLTAAQNLDLSQAASWDAIAPTNYTVAANRAGIDFYIYACAPASGMTPRLLVSDNAVAPVGYTVANSRGVGGFHGLCVAAGAIGGHPLTGFAIGDILPASIWDIDHRPRCAPEGMVFSLRAGIWVDIYFPSGTGGNTASAFGGAISDTRHWMDFVDDGGDVGKRMLTDAEFQIIALGSNEETNIFGGAAVPTAGGHSDTAAQRMISDIGCEDCCGVQHQYLADHSFGLDAISHLHTSTITHKGLPTGSTVSKDQAETNLNGLLGSAANEDINSNNTDPAPAWAYLNLPGARGSLWKQGTQGDVKMLAGGMWNGGADAGSRARALDIPRDTASAQITTRFCCNPR